MVSDNGGNCYSRFQVTGMIKEFFFFFFWGGGGG